MYAKYNKDVEFLLVYIREAHAIDGARPRGGSILVEEPISDLERFDVAKTCMTKLELEMIPSVIDRIDNKVDAAYSAMPDRLYLVGKDGKIVYLGGRGPFGFRPDELISAIQKELADKPGKQK